MTPTLCYALLVATGVAAWFAFGLVSNALDKRAARMRRSADYRAACAAAVLRDLQS